MGAGGSRTSKDDTQDDGLAGTPPKDKDPAGGKFAGIKQKWSKRKLSTIVSDEIRETNRSRVDLMNEAQIDEFREAFTQFDIGKSGSIDIDELRRLCEWIGQEVSEEDLKDMMDLADGDGSGEIDFWEFATLMAHKMGDANPDATLSAAFNVFDEDGDGTISSEELLNVMRNMGESATEEDLQRVINMIDINGDGSVDYDEFARAVTKEMQESGFTLV